MLVFSMPEARELVGELLRIRHGLSKALNDLHINHMEGPLVVQKVWADCGSKDSSKVLCAPRFKEGLIGPLDETCPIKRGSNGGQTALYPKDLKAQNINTLQLESVDAVTGTLRTIILNFKAKVFSVCSLLKCLCCESYVLLLDCTIDTYFLPMDEANVLARIGPQTDEAGE